MTEVTLLEFELSVPAAFYGKDMDDKFSKKHYMYQVCAKRINNASKEKDGSSAFEVVDTVARRYQDFKRLHEALESLFPNIVLPSFPYVPKGKDSHHDDIPPYVEERRAGLNKYIRGLRDIAELRTSYEFQQFLPKICQILAKTRYKGFNLSAKENLGFLNSQNVIINVNSQLKLIRITTHKNATQKAALARSNIPFQDISKWTESTDKGRFKCVVELKDTTREFIFHSNSDLQIFTQLLRDMEDRGTTGFNSTGDLESLKTIKPPAASLASRVMMEFRKKQTKALSLKETPAKDYKIFVTTWNMARTNHEPFAYRLLPGNLSEYDILVFGFQECKSFEGKLRNVDSRIAEHFLERIKDEFFLVGRKAIWEINVSVFVRHIHKADISSIDIKSIATGFLGVVGNKGAAAVAFKILNTSICFVTSHLAAHQGHTGQRNEMFQEIIHGLMIGDAHTYLTHHYDVVVWLGDLNYRINISSENIISHLKRGRFEAIFRKDQLNIEMNRKRVFCGFKEMPITFPPTYKLNMPKSTAPPVTIDEKIDEDDEDDDEDEDVQSSSGDDECSSTASTIITLSMPGSPKRRNHEEPSLELDEKVETRVRALGSMKKRELPPSPLLADVQRELHLVLNGRVRRSSSDPQLVARNSMKDLNKAEASLSTVAPPTSKNAKTDHSPSLRKTAAQMGTLHSNHNRGTLRMLDLDGTSKPAPEQASPSSERERGSPFSSQSSVCGLPARGYDAKRIPAWTDRILSKINSMDEVWMLQLEYTTGPPSNSSDHFPVVAAFRLHAQGLPPTRIYQEKVELYMNSISLSLDRSFLERSKMFEGVDDIYLLFHGVALVQPVSSFAKSLTTISALAYLRDTNNMLFEEKLIEEGNHTASSKASVEFSWEDEQVPSVQLVTTSITYLRKMRVMISVCRTDSSKAGTRDGILAQAQVFLNPVVESNLWSFEAPLSHKGVDAGTISGKVFIDFKS